MSFLPVAAPAVVLPWAGVSWSAWGAGNGPGGNWRAMTTGSVAGPVWRGRRCQVTGSRSAPLQAPGPGQAHPPQG